MEKSAIKKIGEIDCTGCFSCYNKCPIENAIEMKINTEGFYRPFSFIKNFALLLFLQNSSIIF